MKLRRHHNKINNKTIIVLAIILAVVLVAGIVAIIVGVDSAQKQDKFNKEVIRINVSSRPAKLVYYVGETFDPTGLKLQVVTNHQDESYFVEYNEEMNFSGFDSSEPNNAQTITVSYMGFSTTFVVEIKEKPSLAPVLESIEVYNFKTTYTLADWNKYGPSVTGARIRCVYSDGSTEEDIILKNSYIYGFKKLESAGTTEIIIKYTIGSVTVQTNVTITITE